MSDQTSPQEIHISWDNFEADSRALAEKLKGTRWKGLLAITRGGLAPTALLSNYLNITHIETLCLSSYDNRDQGEMNIIKNVNLEDGGKDWLVVDDLADTGKTLVHVKKLLPKAHITTLYVKPAGQHLPDTYLKSYEQSSWIVFPWEV